MKFFSNEGIGSVPGLMGWQHLIFILLSFTLITILLVFTYRLPKDKIAKTIRIIFWVVLILEICKIIWNLTIRIGASLNDWIPLYYCSIFIYGLALASYGKGKVKSLGETWIFYGQIVAGLAFILYPSTALLIHPLCHVLTIHSLIYHSLAIYVGLLIVLSKYYKPQKEDFIPYTISLMIFCLGVYLFNIIFTTNLMFLNKPVDIWPLANIFTIAKGLYPLIIALAQICGTFVISYYSYIIIKKTRRLNKPV